MKIDDALAHRRRLTRQERLQQLLDVAWRLTREEGTDALTLPRLAEQANITKPVVYDHFGTRAGLLLALYRDFDARQTAIIDGAIEASQPTLVDRASVIASSYVDCVLAQGREIPGVISALASSPELEQVKREYEAIFLEKCRAALEPFAEGTITHSALRAMLGAATALSNAAVAEEITIDEAKAELYEIIVAMVGRSGRNRSRASA